MQRKKKILILGLSDSGKTSILLSFKKHTNILSFCSLKPTKNVKVEDIETENEILNIWDFGGQIDYRRYYIQEFDKYTEGVHKIIFVIDVQNLDKYGEALDYLEEIIVWLNKENKEFKMAIFLHKYDPYLEEKEGFENIDEIMKERLIKKIRDLMPPLISYEISKTCIYSTFKKIST